MNPIVIIAIVFLFLFVPTTVFGAEGYFENNYGKQVSRPPTACIFQPNDPRISEQQWKLWYPEMKSAIDTWRSVLQSSGSSGNWDITTVDVPLNKLHLLNYSECDIVVKFIENPYMENGKLANALGWWIPGTGEITLVFIATDYCGKEFLPEYHVTVDKYCYLDTIERPKRMASVLQHEFGHALGMGHYISDNPQLTQQWFDNDGIGAPSIMTFQPPNEELKKITPIDANLVREIYGYQGFGKKTNNTPVFNEPIVEPKYEPVISDVQNIQVKPYQTSSVKISGYIPEELYSRGTPVEFQVTKPDGTKESFATMVSKHQYFEHPMVFGSSSLTGTYEILVIYKGEFVQKNAVNLSKSITSNNNQKSTLPSSNVASGKYLEKISITSDNNEYHVKSFLGKASSSSIKITAENECPVKKQVFQKDFMFRSGTEVSFSFFQLSDGKPNTCSIHFSITDFNGNELDSLKVDYKVQATKKQLTQTEQSTQAGKSFEYKKETLELQKNADQKINSLKSGISSAEKSLKSTNYKKSEAKEEVKKAWDAIWWAKKHLGDSEDTQKEGQKFISKSDFKSAYYKYKYSFDSAKKIEPYLFEITKSLNNAKKLEK